MVFEMPNGEVFRCNTDLDRYHNLARGTTSQRLHRGWTVKECIQNFRHNKVYRFEMPDGSILTQCSDVDKYYGFKIGRTRSRLVQGWTEERCANNDFKRVRVRHTFNMPDGSVLIKCKEVDKYYGFRLGLTSCRLSSGWTEEECALNKRLVV